MSVEKVNKPLKTKMSSLSTDSFKKSDLSKVELLSFLENSPDHLMIVDTSGTFKYINYTAPGLAKEKVIGTSIFEYVPSKFHVHIKRCFDYVMQTRKTGKYETDYVFPDGRIHSYSARVAPIVKSDEIVALSINSHDITEIKETQRALEKSTKLLKSTFSSLSDAIFVINSVTNKIMDCNQAVNGIFGYKHDDCIGRTTQFLHVSQEHLAQFRKKLFHSIETKGCLSFFEFEMKRKNGEIFPTEHAVTPLEDDKKERFAWVSVVRDITHRKEVENKLKKSEERYKTLFENSHSPMLLIDPATAEIIDANPAAIDFYGWEYDKLLQKRITEINTLSKDQVSQEMKKALTRKRKSFLFRHQISNNRIKDVEVYSGPITINGKRLLYSIIHDITTRRKLENERKNLNQTLKEKVEKRTAELEDMNAALKVLLKKGEEDKNELEENIFLNYKLLVSPFLDKLRLSLSNSEQENLFKIVESNLKEVLNPFSKKLSDPMVNLTPIEIQISIMIKQGLSNKEIADTLKNSVRTISNHRDHIRKKLGLRGKRINLQSYLSTL